MNLRGLIGRAEPDFTKDYGPGDQHILYCPLCGRDIHSWSPFTIDPYVRPQDFAQQSELLAVQHFRRYHPRRYRLWERFRWRWAIAGFFG